jgi:hypothetical protein
MKALALEKVPTQRHGKAGQTQAALGWHVDLQQLVVLSPCEDQQAHKIIAGRSALQKSCHQIKSVKRARVTYNSRHVSMPRTYKAVAVPRSGEMRTYVGIPLRAL